MSHEKVYGICENLCNVEVSPKNVVDGINEELRKNTSMTEENRLDIAYLNYLVQDKDDFNGSVIARNIIRGENVETLQSTTDSLSRKIITFPKNIYIDSALIPYDYNSGNAIVEYSEDGETYTALNDGTAISTTKIGKSYFIPITDLNHSVKSFRFQGNIQYATQFKAWILGFSNYTTGETDSCIYSISSSKTIGASRGTITFTEPKYISKIVITLSNSTRSYNSTAGGIIAKFYDKDDNLIKSISKYSYADNQEVMNPETSTYHNFNEINGYVKKIELETGPCSSGNTINYSASGYLALSGEPQFEEQPHYETSLIETEEVIQKIFAAINEKKYNVYYRLDENGPWTKIEDEDLITIGSQLKFIQIENPNDSKKIQYKVALDKQGFTNISSQGTLIGGWY